MSWIEKMLFSTRAMAVMLFVYAISMAVATFVENDFGTPAAKEMIYYSWWFNLVQVLLIINFIVNIWRYRLWRKEKWSVLTFHLAFVIIFIGAAYTHLFSVEGNMNIREGETSTEIISSQTYMKMSLFDDTQNLVYETPYQMTYFDRKEASFPFKRQFEKKYQFKDKVISLKALDFIELAKDTILEGSGKPTLEIVSIGQSGRVSNYIQAGEIKEIAGAMFSFENPIPGSIQITQTPDGLKINSPLEGQSIKMAGQQIGQVTDSLALLQTQQMIYVDSVQDLNLKSLYQIGSANFVLPREVFLAKVDYIHGDKNNPQDQNNANAIFVEYDDGSVKDTLLVRGSVGSTGYSIRKNINGLQVSLGFGSKIIKTPFGMKLRDFEMETYPGSGNPASYASEITVIDNGKEEDYRIYMNNVLDHGGYRFFQSSYDPDQMGTRLSVNQDRPGTMLTYIGYILLFISMFFTLFWKGTRFYSLHQQLKQLGQKRFLVLILVLATIQSWAQDSVPHTHQHPKTDSIEMATPFSTETETLIPAEEVVKKVKFNAEHINELEHLLVQDDQGRIKPLGTHALELLRKIYKSDKYAGLPAVGWFMSVQQDPSLWAKASLIRVTDKISLDLQKKLKVDKTGHTSLLNLVDLNTGAFLLADEYSTAFRKKQSERSKAEQEILNVTERFSILDNIAKGYYLKMIPVKNDRNETWNSWLKSVEPLEIDTTALAFFNTYFNRLGKAQKSGDWQQANKSLKEINEYQQKWGGNVIPPATKVNIEVFYNKVEPFFFVMIAYTFLGIILLILGFIQILAHKPRWLNGIIKATLGITLLVFLIHAIGLSLRWYISGHAPWTNGYEAIIFISWVSVLAGGLLYRNGNALLPAAGCLVAVIMMGFAHGSSLLDPQITPLAPVLNSYWLIIHVGIIASSYAFFGLGMMLSIFSLILYFFKPSKKIQHTIKELTVVNEMSLTIGLFALTVGTFLGGMWANESWGRYWSWDPKETWAFISIITYAIVLHMRLVPGLRGNYAFNVVSLWSISSVIMTYFGVNYYLTGLHTYAAGDSIPIPAWVPIGVVLFLSLSLLSYYFHRKNLKSNQ